MTITENFTTNVKEITRDRVILEKPTIVELLQTYIKANTDRSIYGESIEDKQKPWRDIVLQNKKYLSVMDVEDYSRKNFDMLIASIELNGSKHFNMQMFLGVVENLEEHINTGDYDNRLYGTDDTVHGLSHDIIGILHDADYLPFINNTKTFNCDTVGCIAGFATAVAMDWQEDLVKQAAILYGNQQELFEAIACNFLNMPVSMGKSIFYAEGNSMWSLLAGHWHDSRDLNVFKHLETNDYVEEEFTYPPIELASISHEMAAKVLQLVRDGYVRTDSTNNMPYFSFEYNKIMNDMRDADRKAAEDK
jgi:hypothetical protein